MASKPRRRVISEHAIRSCLPYCSVGAGFISVGDSPDTGLLSRSGSREVWSLVIEEALALRIELASVTEAAALRNGTDIPDMEDAEEVRPVRRWLSLSMWLDDGRRSGNRALTRVTMSAGDKTMNG